MDKRHCSSRNGSRSQVKGGVRPPKLHHESHQEGRSALSLDDLAFVAAMDAKARKKKEDWLEKNKDSKESDYKGESFNHPLASEACGMLCGAIHNMVYKLALGYASSCREDVDDLAQDCMKRITERIGDFNPEMAKFTTWSWRVCISVLNRVYRKESSRNKHLVLVDVSDIRGKYEPRVEPNSLPMLREDMGEAVRELAGRHPKRRRFIEEVFDGTTREGFVSMKTTITNAAEKAGISNSVACSFFEGVIRPFFQKRFRAA